MDPTGTVFIVDDDDTFRASLSTLLHAAQLRVVPFSNGQAFLDHYDGVAQRPSCLILDVCMPDQSGVDLQRALADRGLRIPIIFVSAYDNVEAAVSVMRSGAVDYFQKPYDAAKLLQRIRHAIESDARSCREESQRGEIASRLATLTPREQEVLELLLAGDPPRFIALQLGLSRKTVNVHRGHIMSKLGVHSFADLIKTVHLGMQRLESEGS